MATSSNSPILTMEPVSGRGLEASGLIERLAKEMRAASTSDLPHSYFIEQVKLQLAGLDPDDRNGADTPQRHAEHVATGAPLSVFHSWALPDT